MQRTNPRTKAEISIVVPLYNEEDNVELLYNSIKDVVKDLNREAEIIFVDDGSTDGTFSVLSRLKRFDERLKIIRFSKNFGQTAAMSAGFNYARGEVIITMDGDLQNDPKDIPLLLQKIEEGYDVVSGWRVNRQDKTLTRKIPSIIANWLISLITGVKLHDSGCSLKAYRPAIVKNLRLYGEMHRFIPALASSMGASIAEVKVNHNPRRYGASKYGISRTIRVMLDLLTVKFLLSFITRPLQIFGLWGILFSGVGLLICLYLTVGRLFLGQELADRPLLMLGVMLLVLGVQFIGFGLIGEMQTRTYYEVQNKQTYVIKDLIE
ncbi:MAG TPA: glycosyltransferase family 2 protein [Thermodesulfobacteriota bacterium]|nr:glycosyltransferase family 2 protein [Thermodesulfobacteriota bacterium]